jgi:hypothetical protein
MVILQLQHEGLPLSRGSNVGRADMVLGFAARLGWSGASRLQVLSLCHRKLPAIGLAGLDRGSRRKYYDLLG